MTAARVEAVLMGLRKGLSRTVAGQAAGVSKDSIRRWMERSATFRADTEQAEAESQSMLVGIVLAAAAKKLPNTWQAAAWLLERRWPEVYGQRSKVDISLDIAEAAREVAEEFGASQEAVIAEAEAILRRHGGETR
jgi:hypothetical protein